MRSNAQETSHVSPDVCQIHRIRGPMPKKFRIIEARLAEPEDLKSFHRIMTAAGFNPSFRLPDRLLHKVVVKKRLRNGE